MDDSKLLQESNLAARQPRRVPHQVKHISCNKRRHLASEGRVNLTVSTGRELGSASTMHQDVIHYAMNQFLLAIHLSRIRWALMRDFHVFFGLLSRVSHINRRTLSFSSITKSHAATRQRVSFINKD